MNVKEAILREKANILITDIYSVADEIDTYLNNTHKSKVDVAKAMKNVKLSYKVLEDELRNYKR